MIDLFAVQTQEMTEKKKPVFWTDQDLIDNMTPVIRDSKDPEKDLISIRIGGTTPVKVFNNKGSRTIPKGSMTELEILEQVKGLDNDKLMPALRSAHKGLLASLHKSKIAKATNIAKAKRLKQDEQNLFAIQKQEEQLRIEVNLARLQRDQNKTNTLRASK